MWERLTLYLLLGVAALISLVVAVNTILSGQVGKDGFDGLFLLFSALVLAVIFALNPILAWRRRELHALLSQLATHFAQQWAQRRRRAYRPEGEVASSVTEGLGTSDH